MSLDGAPSKDDVIAGIVTYNPDLDLLRCNVEAVRGTVRSVAVFDNGSSNIEQLRASLSSVREVRIISSACNIGVAGALNELARVAISCGASWLLTLDQDSVAGNEMVSRLLLRSGRSVGLVVPQILDRNKAGDAAAIQRTSSTSSTDNFTRAASKGAITSGALVNVAALRDVGGFDEAFFIDYVDYDLNRRLLDKGYYLLRCNDAYLSHQVGEARPTWLITPRRFVDGRWRLERFYAFGHSPSRCYFKARNRILYSRKHWRSVGLANEGAWQIPQQILLTLIFEGDRTRKFLAFMRGLWDGFRYPSAELGLRYL